MESVHRRKIRRRTRKSRQSPQSDAVANVDAEDTVQKQSDAVSDPERTLSVLLENNEDLLLKVLSYVIDDGLHECRRVCRRWRDACGKLPVELSGLRFDKLHRVVDLFPEAASLNIFRFRCTRDDMERHVLPQLSRLKHLKSLNLCFFKETVDIRCLMAHIPLLDCLRSFSISRCTQDMLNDVLHMLRRMTNLESLSITCSFQTDLEPITELRELKYLCVSGELIVNSRGELLFPSPTRLTRLYVLGCSSGQKPRITWSLQSILPYAQTLQSFDTSFSRALQDLPSTEGAWRAFWRLSSLTVDGLCGQRDSFFRELQEMHHLTYLSFTGEDEGDQQSFAVCLSSLTKLRSLSLSVRYRSFISLEIMEGLTILTQLTHLSLWSVRGDRFRCCPTGILSLSCQFSESVAADFLEVLLPMTNLTSLRIDSYANELRLLHSDGVTPSQFSERLSGLKLLDTTNVIVDHLFVNAVGMLTQLTYLHLGNYGVSVDPYFVCPRLSRLSDLKTLIISSRESTTVRANGFPPLCWPKLRELYLPLSGTDANTHKALWNALPCLRRLTSNSRVSTLE